MKKFLLLAIAALMAGVAPAQTFAKKGKPVGNKSIVAKSNQPQLQISNVTPMMDARAVSKKKTNQLLSKKFNMNNNETFQPTNELGVSISRRAAEVQPEYTGTGTVEGNGTSPWTMLSGTLTTGELCLADIIPSPFTTDGLAVPYTLSGNTLTIQASKVGSTASYNVFIFGATNADGSFTMTLEDDGSLTVPADEEIWYGAFADEFDPNFDYPNTYLGYIEYVSNIKYALPGQILAPTVEYNPTGLYLFANLSSSMYGYNATYSMVPAYSTVTLKNGTVDVADAFEWSIMNYDGDVQTATTTDFTFNTTFNAYTPATLIGYNQGLASDPFALGLKSNENALIFAGDSESTYEMSDGTYSTITLANPDNKFSYYSTLATPDKNTNRSINSLIFYQAKPEAPLYIEGISYSVSRFTVTDAANFTLKCKLMKVTMTEDGWLELGDVIAEADLTANDIETGYVGASYTMTKLNWSDFYVEDEFGWTLPIDHIFLNEEFAVVIEGWDNGTFSCEHTWGEGSSNSQAIQSIFYIATGDDFAEDNLYRMSYKMRQMIGFLGATYGYLYTEDDTNVTIPTTGGQTSIHISPMYSNATGSEVMTRLFLDDNIEGNEIPDWLTVGFANEDYTTTFSYDLVFMADALPAGVEGRQATIVFYQEGAQLTVTVTQGAATGINAVTTSVKTTGNIMYNLAGQRVDNSFKGLVIKDGKKVMMK